MSRLVCSHYSNGVAQSSCTETRQLLLHELCMRKTKGQSALHWTAFKVQEIPWIGIFYGTVTYSRIHTENEDWVL